MAASPLITTWAGRQRVGGFQVVPRQVPGWAHAHELSKKEHVSIRRWRCTPCLQSQGKRAIFPLDDCSEGFKPSVPARCCNAQAPCKTEPWKQLWQSCFVFVCEHASGCPRARKLSFLLPGTCFPLVAIAKRIC